MGCWRGLTTWLSPQLEPWKDHVWDNQTTSVGLHLQRRFHLSYNSRRWHIRKRHLRLNTGNMLTMCSGVLVYKQSGLGEGYDGWAQSFQAVGQCEWRRSFTRGLEGYFLLSKPDAHIGRKLETFPFQTQPPQWLLPLDGLTHNKHVREPRLLQISQAHL